MVGRTHESAQTLANEDPRLRTCTADEALAGAGVVVTATNSTRPVFEATELAPGTHLAMVGSGGPHQCEVPPALLGRAEAIRVDHRPTCLAESGEIVDAMAAGVIGPEVVRELGEVVLGRLAGRQTQTGLTVYKSVGNGTQDAALAAILLGITLPGPVRSGA